MGEIVDVGFGVGVGGVVDSGFAGFGGFAGRVGAVLGETTAGAVDTAELGARGGAALSSGATDALTAALGSGAALAEIAAGGAADAVVSVAGSACVTLETGTLTVT